MANQVAEFFARIFLKNEISPELDRIIDEMLSLNKTIENSKHPEMLVQEKARVEELTKAFLQAGGNAKELSDILTYQGAGAARTFNNEFEKINTNSYNNFRAIGQMDRITREFASGGLNQGLNGLTMFGNSLTRLAAQEGGFKNAITGLGAAFTGPAGIVLGISAAIGFFEEYQKAVKKAEEENQKFAKSLDDAKIKGTEQGLKLQELLTIADDATLSDKKRVEALNAVKNAIGDVNGEIAKGIKTNDDARNAVNTLTQAYIEQAVVAARTAKIASDQILLQNAQMTVAKAKPSDIAKVLSLQATEMLGGPAALGASVLIKALGLSDLAEALNESKRLREDLKVQTQALQDDIKELSKNPFGVGLLTGLEGTIKQKELRGWSEEMKNLFKEVQAYIAEYKSIKHPFEDETLQRKATPKLYELRKGPTTEKTKLPTELPGWVLKYEQDIKETDAATQKLYKDSKDFANLVSKTLTTDIMHLWDALQHGEDIGKTIGDMFSRIAEQIAAAAIQAALFAGIMDLLGWGGATSSFGDIFGGLLGIGSPVGLNTGNGLAKSTFDAGGLTSAIADSGSNNFVLKGNDLVLALQRSNYSLNLRRGA